jgi:hypothetical protein
VGSEVPKEDEEFEKCHDEKELEKQAEEQFEYSEDPEMSDEEMMHEDYNELMGEREPEMKDGSVNYDAKGENEEDDAKGENVEDDDEKEDVEDVEDEVIEIGEYLSNVSAAEQKIDLNIENSKLSELHDADAIQEALNDRYEIYRCMAQRGLQNDDVICKFFGIEVSSFDPRLYTCNLLEQAMATRKLEVTLLTMKLHKYFILDPSSGEGISNVGKYNYICYILSVASKLLKFAGVRYAAKCVTHDDMIEGKDAVLPLGFKSYERSAVQLIFLDGLSKMMDNKYRKIRTEGTIFQEIRLATYRDPNGQEFRIVLDAQEDKMKLPPPSSTLIDVCHTRAWRSLGSIEDVLRQVYNRTDNPEGWDMIYKNPGYFRSLVEYLTNGCDVEFPELIAGRHIRVFMNGLLDTGGVVPVFYSFNSRAKIPRSLAACRFYDQEFDANALKLKHWYNIKTPTFDKIIEYQLPNPYDAEILYALLGRLQYATGSFDGNILSIMSSYLYILTQ